MSSIVRALVLLVVVACSSPSASVAVLNKADGPVERQPAGGTAGPAAVGARFYLGDVVRTTIGGAQLSLHDGAQIAMQPRTALRFVSRGGKTQLDIAEGEIVLDGTGTYRLEIGTLTLEKGSIRIVGGSEPTLELVFGRGELVGDRDERRPLEVGRRVVLELGQGSLAAGVPDAAPIDAMIAGATIEVTGEGIKIQAPGETRWTTLALGRGTLGPGDRIAVAGPASGIVELGGASLELLPGSSATVTESLELAITDGTAVARGAPGESANIAVPGGRVTLPASPSAGAQATIRVGGNGDANIAVIRGRAQLSGTRGSSNLDVQAGGSGHVRAAGTVAPGPLVIPGYFDFEVDVAKAPNITVHDPAGATAVQFELAGLCKGGSVIELGRNADFRAPLVSVGDSSAKLMVSTGRWGYRLRCNGGDVIKSGRLTVVRDRGTRALPRDPPRFEIASDGRNYRLDYQSRIPDVLVRATGKGSSFKLHLVSGTNQRVFSSTTGSFAVPSASLSEHDYTFWVEADGVKSKVSTLRIGFDQTAAQVYIESPIEGRPWGPYIDVAGATLPGWTATIDGQTIASDKQTRRFSAMVASPREAHAIAIQLAHPERGVHVYLRRGKQGR